MNPGTSLQSWVTAAAQPQEKKAGARLNKSTLVFNPTQLRWKKMNKNAKCAGRSDLHDFMYLVNVWTDSINKQLHVHFLPKQMGILLFAKWEQHFIKCLNFYSSM